MFQFFIFHFSLKYSKNIIAKKKVFNLIRRRQCLFRSDDIRRCFCLGVSLTLILGNPLTWNDGSALTFSKWKPGALNAGKVSSPQCAVMMTADDGIWNLVSCQSSFSRVVCKTKASEYHEGTGAPSLYVLYASDFVSAAKIHHQYFECNTTKGSKVTP